MQQKIKALVSELNAATYAYYNQDDSIMSDQEFDKKMRELKKLESEHPEYVLPNSPTKIVGGTATFAPTEHEYKMLSLKDVFNLEDIDIFVEQHKTQYVVEPKIDGLSMQVEYCNGELIMAATRGDGKIGDDVTENAKCIVDLPLTLVGDNIPSKVIVRGEVYLRDLDFEELNKVQKRSGEKQFANPRNAASGTLRQKSTQVVRNRRLRFFAFTLENAVESFKTQTEALQWLDKIGFNVVESIPTYNPRPIIEKIGRKRGLLPFGIDGVAIKINDLTLQQKIGNTAKYPKWAVAYKFPAQTADTTLRNVIYQTGRTGKITPVAVFDVVSLCGTRVQHATLHNAEYMDAFNLHEGDVLTIYKAGDIIPEVRSARRGVNGKKIIFPTTCPSCGNELVYRKGYFCENIMCPAQNLRRIKHFVSKDALNIQGCGEQTIIKLLDAGIINEAIDLYCLTKEDILVIEGYSEVSAIKLLEGIEASKCAKLDRVIYALGINGVGSTIATNIAERFKSFSAFCKAKKDDLNSIQLVGDVVSDNVIQFMMHPSNQKLINYILGNFQIEWDKQKEDLPLMGKVFVITGTHEMPRKYIQQIIIDNGGRIGNAVTGKTNYLVAGENAGKKLQDAQANGVEIINLRKLIELIG